MSDECPSCGGTGFELETAADGVVRAVRCACSRRDLGERLLRRARIPRRYDHCSFDSFEVHDRSHEAALREARQWVELWPVVSHGLLLIGEPGTGKTHIAVALARELIRTKSAQVLFYEQRELLKALQGTFESGAALRESEILVPVQEAEVLVLDDLGAGRTTAWARDVMHDVIVQRYNEQRPLVMTTNLRTGEDDPATPKAAARAADASLSLRDRLGDALMSRLYEMCKVVNVRGKDYRSWILRARHGV